MKIKSLKIHNIASIADAFIDFDASPLADADIFLITGDTGAGKSTILDCICLALYNTAPRLEGTLMEGRIEQNDEYNGIALDDSRQFLRRNTGEGEVTLVFEGNNGKIYTARWRVQRAYCKPTGRLQKTVHEFECGSQKYTGANLREERMVAVGVEYGQFVRTTMLAQGEFTRFLNCNDKEKASVLMQILDVDIYEKISRQIHKRTSAEEETLARLQMKVDTLELLSPEQQQSMQQEKTTITARLAEVRAAEETDNIRKRWLAEGSEIAKGITDAENRLNAQIILYKSDNYANNVRFITAYDASSETLSILKQILDARKQLKTCLLQREALKGEFVLCSSGLSALEEASKAVEANITLCDRWFADNKDLERTTALSNLVIQNIKNYFTAKKRLADNTTKHAELLRKLEIKDKERTAALQVVEASAAKLAAEREVLNNLEEKLAALKPDELQTRANALATREASLDVAKVLVGDAESRTAEHATASQRLADLSKEIEAARVVAANTAKEVDVAQADLDRQAKILDKASQGLSDWSRRMRSELSVGDLCPVCRRRIDEAFDSDEEILKALQPLKDALEECRIRSKNAVENHNSARVTLEAKTRLMENTSREVERLARICNDARSRVDKHCSALGVTVGAIDAAVQACETEREKLRPLLGEAASLKQSCDEKRKTVDAAVKEKESADRELKTIDEAIADARLEKSSLEALLATEKTLMDDLSLKLSDDVTGSWKFVWSEHPREFIDELETAVGLRHSEEEKREALRRELERLAGTVVLCREASADILRLMPAWALENPESRPVDRIESKFPALKARIEANLAVEAELSALLGDLKATINQYFAAEDSPRLITLCRMLRKSAEEIQTVRRIVENVKSALSEARGAYDSLCERRENHFAARPDMPDDDTPETIDSRLAAAHAEIDACVARLAIVDEAFRRDNELRLRMADMIDEIEKQKAVLADWKQLDRHFGSADGRQFSKIALRYVLGHLLEKANIYLQKIMPRYRLLCRPDSFIIMVEDAYQNGALRSANVISGGESFIVSLVLALALSDVGSRLKVDILFIDEGFGTLSGDALEAAVETLRTLRSAGGRRVGIISHVAELRERIPAKISVRRDGRSAATVEVSVD